MNYLTLDFETYYEKEINLKKLTTQAYVMHPQMEVLMVAVKFNDDPVQVIDGEQIPTFFATVDWSNTAVIAHNAVFDGSILYWRYGVRPAVLIDTMSMAQALGVQTIAGGASLAACIRLLQEAGYEVPPKGTEVLDALGKRRADFTPQQWAAYREYCKNDTDITWFLFKVLRQYLTDEEMRFQDIILRCYTEPRLTVDIPTVEYELNRCRTYKAEQLAEVCKMFNTTQDELSAHLRSNDKFAEVLRSMGGITEEELEQGKTGAFIIPTKVSEKTGKTTWAFGKTDVAFKELCEHDDPKVQAICQARLAAKSSIDETRCLKFLEYGSYGFLPMGYKIGGAHTNRMSGGAAGCFVGETMIVVLPVGADVDEWEYRMIKDVQLTDLIWDGSDWCAHDGVVCHGVKRVYNWDGLTATENHECFTNSEREYTKPFKWFMDNRYALAKAQLPAGGKQVTPVTNLYYADGAKVMVYDILNVGPRHCYVANGKLVHNSANMQNLPSGRREGQSDLLRRSIIAQGNAVIINFDASQIECLDSNGTVLTQRGLVKMRDISIDDLLWDGVEWVSHDGLVMKGIKDVITYSGITGTPNHIVYTTDGRAIPLGQAAAEHAKILVGEVGGKAVRAVVCAGQTHTIDDTLHSSVVSLPVRGRTASERQRREAWGLSWLRGLYEPQVSTYTQATSEATATAVQRIGREMQGEQVHLQTIQERRKSLHFLRRLCGVYVGDVSNARLSGAGDRPYRYQWSLCQRESTTGNARAECPKPELQCHGLLRWARDVGVEIHTRLCEAVRCVYGHKMVTQWDYAGASSGYSQNAKARMVGTQGEMVFPRRVYKAVLSTLQPIYGTQSDTQRYDEWGNPITGTIEVFDIVNAGPRHRFTYNGLVVSNCRVLAYVANQTDVLGVFASGGDVYSFAASKIHGIPYQEIVDGRKSSDPATAHKYSMMRQYGKTATLALGYGQGAQGFQRYALLNAGINMTMDESARTVRAWRDANGFITGFWRMCDQALATMVAGGQLYFGGPDGKMFFADGNRYIFGRKVAGIRMPNGLWLNYPNLSADFTNPRRPQYFYDKCGYNGKPLKTKVYSGLVAENITQALAFAIMKTQAVWIAQYYPIVMNTHDEWCIVVPREQAEVAAEYMHRCMCTAPEYIKGITLESEGGWAQSYGAVDDDWSKRPNNPDRKHIFNPQTGEIL